MDRTPVIPSHELSGTVAALGDGAGHLAVGDEVIGLIDFDLPRGLGAAAGRRRDGAAAEYVVVPAATLAAKPATVSHQDAAVLPLAALTAWQALVDYAALEPGERVLVLGGAGGVGLFAVQLAAILGGPVTATGRAADAGLVRDLGAAYFASFDAPGTAEPPAGFGVVIDTVGGAALAGSYALLRAGGRLVTLGAPPDSGLAAQHKVHAMFFVVAQDPAGLAQLVSMAGAGQLRSVISQTFPLAGGRRAYEPGGHPRPPGKTVLVVRE